MELLTTLLLAHLLADFPLQTNAIAAGKSTSMRVLLLHVTVHMMVLGALLSFDWATWPIILGLGSSHFLIDWLKPRVPTLDTVQGFVIDQLAHISSILIIAASVDAVFHHRVRHALSTTLLYPSLGVGLTLALMVFGWIWVNTLQEEVIQQNSHLRWGRDRLLEFEQRAGFGLLCVLGLSFFFTR
ncbi:MAG: DUF3307 domain-containing protein [Caldilineaceae bacterium]